jgi:hypothetical protein
MKMRIRPDDASMLQMNDWLAELRGDERAEPPAPTIPAAAAVCPEPAVASPQPPHPQPPHPQPARVQPAHARPEVGALIGDQLRMPIMWCEMGSCISWHADPAALGEGDMRARAIGAGWRIDAFGRLACPCCQQTDPAFRASRPVVVWDRHTAMARAARIVTQRSDPPAPEPPAAPGRPPASPRRARRGLRSAAGQLHSGPWMAPGEPVGTDGGIDDPGIRRGGLPGPMAARR